jgi:hypothetical protein
MFATPTKFTGESIIFFLQKTTLKSIHGSSIYIYMMVVLINKIPDGFSISMPDTGMVKHTPI